MKKFLTIFASIMLAMTLATSEKALAKDFVLAAATKVEVYFSPDGGATDAVVAEIGRARTQVLVLAYSFTSRPIAQALIDAHARGLDVRIVVDHSQETESWTMAGDVQGAGIDVVCDEEHKIAHNKVMVLDGTTLITGSFNFTAGAEHANAENLLIVHSPDLAAEYAANWREHYGHSVHRDIPASRVRPQPKARAKKEK